MTGTQDPARVPEGLSGSLMESPGSLGPYETLMESPGPWGPRVPNGAPRVPNWVLQRDGIMWPTFHLFRLMSLLNVAAGVTDEEPLRV